MLASQCWPWSLRAPGCPSVDLGPLWPALRTMSIGGPGAGGGGAAPHAASPKGPSLSPEARDKFLGPRNLSTVCVRVCLQSADGVSALATPTCGHADTSGQDSALRVETPGLALLDAQQYFSCGLGTCWAAASLTGAVATSALANTAG